MSLCTLAWPHNLSSLWSNVCSLKLISVLSRVRYANKWITAPKRVICSSQVTHSHERNVLWSYERNVSAKLKLRVWNWWQAWCWHYIAYTFKENDTYTVKAHIVVLSCGGGGGLGVFISFSGSICQTYVIFCK